MTFLEYIGLATVAFVAAWISQIVYHTFIRKADLTQYKSKDGWALVTGCTGGIGEGFAQELAARGFNVLLVGRSEKKLKELQDTLKAQAPSVKTAYAVSDATKSDEANIGPVVDAAAKVNLRLLINNVGVSTEHSAPYSETSADDIAAMIAVNCTYGTVLTQKLVPLLTKNSATNRTAIINVSSQSAWFHVPHLAVYSATKAFNLAFSNALRAELAENNIDVLALTPGFVATAMTRMRPSSMVPTARRCASDALDKIGLRSHCGFWAHELTLRLGMLVPADWRGAISLAGMKKANEARLRKVAKMATQAKTQ